MTVKEISKSNFVAIFGEDEARDGNYTYYLTKDNLGFRKKASTNSVEIVGTKYDNLNQEQLEKDILNSICGEFKDYEIPPTNRPIWEWEKEARPNIFLYYLPQISLFIFVFLILFVFTILLKT